MAPTLRTARYSLLLRSDRQVERRLGSSPFATAVAGAANVLVAAGMRRGEPRGLHIETFTGRFGDEFTALDGSLHAMAPMRACRGAEDLNWQYRDDPLRSYEILVARRAGEVSGFVVVSRAGEDAWIVEPPKREEIFTEDPDDLWAAVLRRKGRRYALLSTMPPDPSLN